MNTFYRHGQWVTGDGEPVKLPDFETEFHAGAPEQAPEPEDKPKRTRSAKKDPRESKGAQ